MVAGFVQTDFVSTNGLPLKIEAFEGKCDENCCCSFGPLVIDCVGLWLVIGRLRRAEDWFIGQPASTI